LTKNSQSRNLNNVFEECLLSLKRNVPVSTLIVVDAYSNDNTIESIEKHFKSLIVIKSRALRGKAREIGIKHVKTPYFMFIDDDVILCEKWFEKAFRYFQDDERVGAVWGADLPGNPHIRSIALTMSKFRRKTLADIAIRNFKIRGGTHDILIKTDIVKDIQIPNDLHIYEDAYIKEYIERKGYKVIATNNPYCIHKRRTDKWNLQKGTNIAYLELKYGFCHNYTGYYLTRNFILAIPKSLAILIFTKDEIAAKRQFEMYLYMFLGYLKAKFGLNPKRIPKTEIFNI